MQFNYWTWPCITNEFGAVFKIFTAMLCFDIIGWRWCGTWKFTSNLQFQNYGMIIVLNSFVIILIYVHGFAAVAVRPSYKEIWWLGFSGLLIFHLLCCSHWQKHISGLEDVWYPVFLARMVETYMESSQVFFKKLT